MRGRAGVVALMLALFGAGIAASAIHAGSPLSTTTTSDTTTTTSTTPTTTDVTTQTTSGASTTTAATTTTTTTTTTTATTTASPPEPAGKPLVTSQLAKPRCLLLAGFALLEPGRRPLALGRVAVVP